MRLAAGTRLGPYEVLSRLPGAKVTFVGKEVGPVRTETRALALMADGVLADAGQAGGLADAAAAGAVLADVRELVVG